MGRSHRYSAALQIQDSPAASASHPGRRTAHRAGQPTAHASSLARTCPRHTAPTASSPTAHPTTRSAGHADRQAARAPQPGGTSATKPASPCTATRRHQRDQTRQPVHRHPAAPARPNPPARAPPPGGASATKPASACTATRRNRDAVPPLGRWLVCSRIAATTVSQSARSTPWPAPLERQQPSRRGSPPPAPRRARAGTSDPPCRGSPAWAPGSRTGARVTARRPRWRRGSAGPQRRARARRRAERARAMPPHRRGAGLRRGRGSSRPGTRPPTRRSDQSTSAVATKRPNSSVGGGSPRSPGVTGEVLIRTSESTRSAKSSARSWANAPPAETPTT